MEFPRVRDDRAGHTFPVWAAEEKCARCGAPAAHKVEDVSGPEHFHPMTAYLCCEHFTEVMGPVHGSYPYDFDGEQSNRAAEGMVVYMSRATAVGRTSLEILFDDRMPLGEMRIEPGPAAVDPTVGPPDF